MTVSEGAVEVIFKGGGCVDALDLKIISEGYEIFLEAGGDGLYLMWGLLFSSKRVKVNLPYI